MANASSSRSFDVCYQELKAQFKIVIPVCCTMLLRKWVDIVSVIYVGHLGARSLSAAGDLNGP
jgi:Na+-driven multidrug efflux pump